MTEKILKILPDEIFKDDEETWCDFKGYRIVTDKQTINVGVSSGQSCCEDYGYMISEDMVEDFVGADFNGIEIVDTALNVKKWTEQNPYGLDEGGAMFVNVITSKGTFQIVVYNSHNGYYGHSAVVMSNKLSKMETL